MTPRRSISDPEVLALVRLFESARDANTADSAWLDSPLAWFKALPSRTKGRLFESVVHRWCEEMQLEVGSAGDSDADRVIEGKRFEIKGSMLWKNGTYRFQQLRDQRYDAVICLGISPFDAHCWVLPKAEVLARWKRGDIPSQHGGRHGQDTAWLIVAPEAPPTWLSQHGGSLGEAKRVLRELVAR